MNRFHIFPHYLLVFVLITFLFASASSQTPDSLFVRGNKHYEMGQFEEAANYFQQAVDSGYVAAELFFNLGNAYFKQNRIALAILNYERALLLKPNNDDFQFNLEMAYSFTSDKIEPLPEMFLVAWYKNATSFLNSTQWGTLSIVFFALSLALFLHFWFTGSRVVKRLSFSFSTVALLVTLVLMLFASSERRKIDRRDSAIIMAPVVAVKSSPGNTGKDIFILHAGTKVKITNSIGEWNEIRIANGNKGWLPLNSIERI